MFELALHANGGRETAEEEPAELENAPRALQHGLEVRVIPGKMENSVADDHVRRSRKTSVRRVRPENSTLEAWAQTSGRGSGRYLRPGRPSPRGVNFAPFPHASSAIFRLEECCGSCEASVVLAPDCASWVGVDVQRPQTRRH